MKIEAKEEGDKEDRERIGTRDRTGTVETTEVAVEEGSHHHDYIKDEKASNSSWYKDYNKWNTQIVPTSQVRMAETHLGNGRPVPTSIVVMRKWHGKDCGPGPEWLGHDQYLCCLANDSVNYCRMRAWRRIRKQKMLKHNT